MLARNSTFAACLFVGLSSSRGFLARADLIELPDGRIQAGRVVAGEANTPDRFLTGTPGGSQELRLAADGGHRLIRALEEDRLLRECGDSELLRTWAAGYFFSSLEAQSRKCAKQAWELAPSIGDEPFEGGSPEFCAFWNRLVLKEKSALVRRGAVAEQVALARWAREAGLADESGYHLRSAWHESEKKDTTIGRLAESWGVELESWIELDLKAAVDRRLFSNSIQDEDALVRADVEHEFLHLPFWYDRRTGPRVLSDACVRGLGKRVFYGLYFLPDKPEPGQVAPLEEATVYEQLELSNGRDGRDVSLWNRLGAKVGEGKTSPRERLANRPEQRPASGWGVLILELPDSQAEITLNWVDGGAETLDLQYLRSVSAPIGEAARRDPKGADVRSSLRRLAHPSGAICELAIYQLQRIRGLLAPGAMADWEERIDPKIALAAGRSEDQVLDAAWAYFSSRPALSSTARKAIRVADVEVQTAWISLVSARLRLLDELQKKTAVDVLWTLMESSHAATCRQAFAALIQTGDGADWSRIEHASEAGRQAALERLNGLPREHAVHLLIALMKSIKEPLAGEVATRAKALGLSLSDPRDPILARWSALRFDADRVGLLKVLGAVDLGDLAYSKPFADVLDQAMPQGTRTKIAQAAMEAAVAQFERRLVSVRPANPDGPRQTCFPVLLGHGARDSFIRAVIDAACHAPGPLRFDALALVVEAGYSREAETCLLFDEPPPEELASRLRGLMSRSEIAGSNGLLGLLGRLLNPNRSQCARLIFSHLNRVYADTPIDRGWRVLAAVKAGADLEALAALADELEEPTATSASRWLNTLGHLTQQDLQRIGACRSADERRSLLERIDLRRAQLPEGRYGVIGVFEVSVRREYVPMGAGSGDATQVRRWSVPSRHTVLLPSLEIRTGEADKKFEVCWGGKVIGSGEPRKGPRPLRKPDSLPVIVTAPQPLPEHALLWGWPQPNLIEGEAVPAMGPAVLQGRMVLRQPSQDTMNLDLTEYFRAGLPDSGVFSGAESKALIPPDYKLTLRYATCASYYGIGPPRLELGNIAEPGTKHLINVLLILERID